MFPPLVQFSLRRPRCVVKIARVSPWCNGHSYLIVYYLLDNSECNGLMGLIHARRVTIDFWLDKNLTPHTKTHEQGVYMKFAHPYA